MTTFFRLVSYDDKAATLSQCIRDYSAGITNADILIIDALSFRKIPGSPFAYWIGKEIQNLFLNLSRFENDTRTVRQGLATNDDFRWLRVVWEAPINELNKTWRFFAKGGEYSKYYSHPFLVVEWANNGKKLKEWKLQQLELGIVTPNNSKCWNEGSYFRKGLTWPRRTNRLGFRVLPQGAIFADKGPAVFVENDDISYLFTLLGLFNSSMYLALLQTKLAGVELARSFEVGLIQSSPIPDSKELLRSKIGEFARSNFLMKRTLDTVNESSQVFILPSLLLRAETSLLQRTTGWQRWLNDIEFKLEENQLQINDIAFQLYGITDEDRRAIEDSLENGAVAETEDDEEEVAPQADGPGLVAALLSWTLGGVLGRWDVRLATGEREIPELPDPFAPLPACSPGMLTGPDGLPASQPPQGYPLAVDPDGLLVDDPKHSDDIMKRVQDGLQLLWGERADAIEQEACAILKVKSLREYFRKASKGGFWADHISRYSKSRRKAPIYWLLQSKNGNYGLWLYYHRLDKDILFKALLHYVEPKVKQEQSELEGLKARLLSESDGKTRKQLEREVEKQADFVSELQDFQAKLKRAADMNLVPDLNDGVVLNIAPLRELVPWAEAKKYWEELMQGKYEWSSIAQQLRQKGIVTAKQKD